MFECDINYFYKLNIFSDDDIEMKKNIKEKFK